MSKLVVYENVTLDGVMQAPGRPDEDLRGGFEQGGWALPYNDEVMGRRMGEGMARGGALLQALMQSNLVDEFVLLIYPLVLGSGRRLFPDGGASAALRLVDSVTTTTGVVIATYQVAEPATGESA